MSLSSLARLSLRSTTPSIRSSANHAKLKHNTPKSLASSGLTFYSYSIQHFWSPRIASTSSFQHRTFRQLHSTLAQQCSTKFDLPEIKETLDLLAQNKLIKAESVASRALEIAKYAVGEKSLDYTRVVELLARCKFARGQYPDTAKLYQSCIETYLTAGDIDSTIRCLPNFTTSCLRANGKLDLSEILTSVIRLASKAPSLEPRLQLAISQTILKLLSVEYHKYRLEGDHTQMQRTEDVAVAEIARVDLSGLPSHSVEAAGWNLVVGRWYFTLYEQRKEEKTLEQAKKSFVEASKVAHVDGADARLVDLIKADALLGLGDLARLSSKWEEADEHYKIAVDLTDKHFDRDSQRVRRVIEREAIVQYHMKRWLHAEGLLRRLLDYYNEHSPIGESLPQAQAECMNNYVKMMESRGRGSETESLKAKLSSVQTILPYPTFDPYAF